MSRKGISIVMKRQIKEMLEKKVPIRKIAQALDVSRNTVRRIIRAELSGTNEVEALSTAKMDVLTKNQPPVLSGRPWLAALGVTELIAQRKKGRSIKALYEEHEPSVSYSSFRKALNILCHTEKPTTLKLLHRPGEKAFVDYCDGIHIYNRSNSEKKVSTQFFCGVLPFSSLTFGEFVIDQKLESFIGSHENMWAYFGGITRYVVVDNLKSGVHKAHLYDPEVNPTYCGYANSRGFAVLPARPYTPRDKASIEAAIGVIQRDFFETVSTSGRKFYDLFELNQTFREYLDSLNHKVMKDYGVSRRDRFQEERPHLLPRSEASYEISTWKEVTVHPDCHVQILYNFYSVPHLFVGQKLRVRLLEKAIEIFDLDGNQVAAHARLRRDVRGKYQTLDSHYPEHKQNYVSFDLKKSLAKAAAIGPKTHELVDMLFQSNQPLRYLRPVQGIIRLSTKFSDAAIEYAAAQAMTFKRFRLAFITNCAEYYSLTPNKVRIVTPHRDASTTYLHEQPLLSKNP